MIYTMKKERIFWASVCLLLSCASVPITAVSEGGEEHKNITDAELPALKLVNSFCAFKADGGPCKAMLKRYFFNVHTQHCEEFVYGGCEGNQNRFESLEVCKEKCTRDYPKTTGRIKTTLQKEKPDFCFLEEDAGICRGYITRYFYNNQSRQCERFKYGGCLGNLNNFESLEECQNTCEDALNTFQVDDYRTQLDPESNDSLTPQPTKVPSFLEFYGPSWCLTPADRGLCQANESRFYYNSVIGKCRPFKYSGCGGNENNFTSKKACLRACKKGFIQSISKGDQISLSDIIPSIGDEKTWAVMIQGFPEQLLPPQQNLAKLSLGTVYIGILIKEPCVEPLVSCSTFSSHGLKEKLNMKYMSAASQCKASQVLTENTIFHNLAIYR